MERSEAAVILADLKTQFEILDDLANMDWMIFTYEAEPPWFYISAGHLEEYSHFYWDGTPRKQSEGVDEWNAQVKELRAHLIDTIAALDFAAKSLTE